MEIVLYFDFDEVPFYSRVRYGCNSPPKIIDRYLGHLYKKHDHYADQEDSRSEGTKLLPKLLATVYPDVDLKYCTWSMSKGKASTARCIVFKELGVPLTYTVEASFYAQRPNETPHIPQANQQYEFTRARLQLLGPFMALAMAMIFQTDLGSGANTAETPAETPAAEAEQFHALTGAALADPLTIRALDWVEEFSFAPFPRLDPAKMLKEMSQKSREDVMNDDGLPDSPRPQKRGDELSRSAAQRVPKIRVLTPAVQSVLQSAQL